MGSRRSLLALVAVALACTGTPPTSAPLASASTAPPPEDPCDVAAKQRARIPALREAGRLDRSLRVLAHAAELCPRDAALGADVEAAVIAELGPPADRFADTDEAKAPMREAYIAAASLPERDAEGRYRGFLRAWELWHPNGQALVHAGLAARALGRAADAQRLFDRGLHELEIAQSEKVRVEVQSGLASVEGGLAWSPAGRVVLIGGGVAKLLSQSDLGVVDQWGERVVAARFSPDGGRVVTVEANGTVEIHESRTGLIVSLLTSAKPVLDVALSEDRAAVVGVDAAGNVYRWRTKDGALESTWKTERPCETGALSLDGAHLACAGIAGVDLYDVAKRTHVKIGAADPTTGVALSDDGTRVAQFTAYEVRAGGEVAMRPLEISGAGSFRSGVFSPDGTRFAAVRRYATEDAVVVWDVKTRGVVATFDDPTRVDGVVFGGRVRVVAWSPDGKVVGAAFEHSLRMWSLETKKEARSLKPSTEPEFGVRFCGDGATTSVATGGLEGLRVYRTRPEGTTLETHATDGYATSVDCTRDGARFVVGDASGMRGLDDKGFATIMSRFTAEVDLAPDGARAWGRLAGIAVDLWDVDSGARVASVPEDLAAKVNAMVPGADGTLFLAKEDALVAARTDPFAPIWEQKDPSGNIQAMTISSDGVWVGTCSGRARARVAATGAPVFELAMDASCVDLAFSPDRSFLAIATSDGGRLYRISDDAPRERVNVELAPSRAVAFSRDGRVAAFAGETGVDVVAISGGEAKTGARIARVRGAIAHDAGYVLTSAGEIELVGAARADVEPLVSCRAGKVRLPFDACRERFEATGLLARALRGEAARTDP